MGKAAILIVTASVILGSVYAFGAREEVRNAEARLSTHQYEILARNAALAGFNVAKQQLAEDFATASPTFSGTYDDSEYAGTISYAGAVANVVSVGTTTGPGGKEVTFTVDASIEKEAVTQIAEQAPPFMRYAVLSEDDLGIDGNVLADLYVDGNEENTLNANMHTNGNLHINGNAAEVRGFGTYVGSGTASPSSALTSTFRPYYNPSNEPVVKQIPAIEVPVFDVAAFLSKTSVDHTTTGDLTLSGTYSLGGTREDPYVWHVDGNVSASGGVTIDGYAMFIVDGDATLSGNLAAGDTGYEGGDESSIGIYASGSIYMSGTSDIHGQLFAGTSASVLSGSPSVYGNVASKGSVELSGSPKIYYRVPSPALTTIFEDPEYQLKLIAYSEW